MSSDDNLAELYSPSVSGGSRYASELNSLSDDDGKKSSLSTMYRLQRESDDDDGRHSSCPSSLEFILR